VQKGYPLLDGFLRTLTEQYGSQVRALDFGDELAALNAVNGWANQYTAGRIPKILESLDPLTRAVIANAVYLKADWTRPFRKAGDRDFAVAGSQTPVPMMDRKDRLGYTKGAGWQSVDVPYFGDTLAMRVIVPTGDKTPADLLTPAVLDAAAKTAPTELELTMPLWDFGTKLDLRALMPELGVTDLFQEGTADLTGITEAERLFVMQAVHKANITVDELGTVASAVTALGVGVTSAQLPPPVSVTVDRPFVFQIIEVKTGATLFVGHVADPRAH
jgi:serpin B